MKLKKWLFGHNDSVIDYNKNSRYGYVRSETKGAFGGKNKFSYAVGKKRK